MAKKRFSSALLPAVLGALQPPLHMAVFVLLHMAQGERNEELAGGFFTGLIVWALCAVAALLLARRSPQTRGNGAAQILSILGLALFGLLAVLFAGAALFAALFSITADTPVMVL